MAISGNIKKLRLKNDWTQEQLAERLGVSRATVTQWETGWSQPRMGAVSKLAGVFGVAVSEIVDGAETSHSIDVPVFGSIAAGKPMDMDTFDEFFPVPSRIMASHPNSFLLRVCGDSMNRRIPDGMLALVDPDDCEPNGRSAYAVCINESSATLKRVKKLANGYELSPDSYDLTQRPIVFDYGNDDCDTLTVIGKVIWVTAPYGYEI